MRLPDGRVVVSSEPGAVGQVATPTDDFRTALEGDQATANLAEQGTSEAVGPALATSQVLREYFPLVTDGQVRAVVGIWRDAVPILAQLEELRRGILLVTLSAALIAATVLVFVFRSAQSRISRQAAALAEAAVRDPLTGKLNHGAVVDTVALAVERSRADGRPFGIALLDVDNFRLLNETYGHGAGDDVLVTVVDVVADALPSEAILGRYGPRRDPRRRAGRADPRHRNRPRNGPSDAGRPCDAVRRIGTPAGHDQRRRLLVPGPCRLGHGSKGPELNE